MTCNDCPNQTDGKCCHQLIRPQGSKTMNLLDDRANDEADRHAQMMQSQRKEKPKSLRDILVEHGIGAFKETANEK